MPPVEEDELISSWLGRTARFYGMSVSDLFDGNGVDRSISDLAAIDVGLPRAVIRPIARLLNITVDGLAKHTIAVAYPWAIGLLARESYGGTFDHDAPLRPAVCPLCLDQQRATRGFSWLRSEWVLAWRTMCSRHSIRLIEGGSETVHPAWQGFFGRHHCIQQATCPAMPNGETQRPQILPAYRSGATEAVDSRLLQIQDVLVTNAAVGKNRNSAAEDDISIVVGDVLWALTRVDRGWPDRLAYEEFALPQFDSDWHIARRRRLGPTDYTRLGVFVRHAMMAAAVVLADDPDRCPRVAGPGFSTFSELMRLLGILTVVDANELRTRSARWPARFARRIVPGLTPELRRRAGRPSLQSTGYFRLLPLSLRFTGN